MADSISPPPTLCKYSDHLIKERTLVTLKAMATPGYLSPSFFSGGLQLISSVVLVHPVNPVADPLGMFAIHWLLPVKEANVMHVVPLVVGDLAPGLCRGVAGQEVPVKIVGEIDQEPP